MLLHSWVSVGTLPFVIDLTYLAPGQHNVSLFLNTSRGAASVTIPFTVAGILCERPVCISTASDKSGAWRPGNKANTHTHIHTCTHTHMHNHTCTHTHTTKCTHNTHTHTHPHTHTPTHTHTHTQLQTEPFFEVTCQVSATSTTLIVRSCPANRELESIQCSINNGPQMDCEFVAHGLIIELWILETPTHNPTTYCLVAIVVSLSCSL